MEAAGHFRGVDGAEEEVAGEKFAREEDGEGEPGVDKGEDDGEASGDEADSGDFSEWAKAEEGAVLVRAPGFFPSREEGVGFVGEGAEGNEEKEGGMNEESCGGGEGEEEGGESSWEIPGEAFGVLIDHDAGEDCSEEEGDEGEFCRDGDGAFEGEVGEEGEGCENCRNGSEEGEGEDFPGEPGGFEAEEEASGFERFSEVEGCGDHVGVEDQDSNDGVCRTSEQGGGGDAQADLGEGEHEGERPVGGLGIEL